LFPLSESAKWFRSAKVKVTQWLVVPVASLEFVAGRGKDWNYIMGHSRLTSGPGAAAARWLIVLWLMQCWSKELWVVDICIS